MKLWPEILGLGTCVPGRSQGVNGGCSPAARILDHLYRDEESTPAVRPACGLIALTEILDDSIRRPE